MTYFLASNRFTTASSCLRSHRSNGTSPRSLSMRAARSGGIRGRLDSMVANGTIRDMTYVITTRTVVPYEPHRRTSRVAVASLDEPKGARTTVGWAIVDWFERAERHGDPESLRLQGEAMDLPESGGTIGPLPDGTVIEVAAGWPIAEAAEQPDGTVCRMYQLANGGRVLVDFPDWAAHNAAFGNISGART